MPPGRVGAELVAATARRLQDLPRADAESLRRVRRELTQVVADIAPRSVLRLAHELLATRLPGSHVVAYELIREHPAALASVGASELRRLGKAMASWAEVDTFACCVAGPAWRAGQIEDAEIAAWTASASPWWRRAALVSTVPLNVKAQGGAGDARRTLAVCVRLLDDRDPVVVKALSWALRALAVRDATVVQAFAKRHESRLAPRVVREVRSKLLTGRKS